MSRILGDILEPIDVLKRDIRLARSGDNYLEQSKRRWEMS